MKVLLIDGHSLAYRAFYALPPDLRTSSGQVTNAVYGFTGMLIKALQDHKTDHIAVAFDKGRPLERLAIRPEYKEQRTSAPDEFRQQVGLIREVLEVLHIPVFEVPNVEADDIIYILGTKAAGEGAEVIIVTADRDYFQMVGPRIKLMMNKRGISETVIYDEAAVVERYGFPPERYLEYAALRGDPSDNIQGVPGVGEKTAAKLIQTYGTLEEVFAHLDEATPKLRANLAEAQQRLLENREFFRFRDIDALKTHGTDVELFDIDLGGLKMGDWDFTEIRKLFDALEFRVLYDRLAADRPEALEAVEGFEAQVIYVDESNIDAFIATLDKLDRLTARFVGEGRPKAIAFAVGDTAWVAEEPFIERFRELLSSKRIITHGSKLAIESLLAMNIEPLPFEMDTEIAAYLVEPARGSYALDELARHHLGKELRLDGPDEEQGSDAEADQQQLLLDDETKEPTYGLQVLAIAELADVLGDELKKRGASDLFYDLELPLAAVLAEVESHGVKIDVDYLKRLSKETAEELQAIETQIYLAAGESFNIGSTRDLSRILYDKLGLKASKKTSTGKFSTDASVLETLREAHPVVELILRHREKAKLKSTYLDALPPLADPKTDRIHCRFNQTVAATGRLSSERPNLQNIPIRTEEGLRIRRAFITEPGHVLIVADYSQIELRILAHLSKDEELVGAFRRGDDIHKLSIAKALGIDTSEVTPQLRSIGKMVSYGVTYGMGAFGLSQRLRIP
ncbi:MAG: DNA polymerase I, partial [Actinobacteria bacterium]|nr:DNA polymerase I [Actinomycetota bacterium]